MNSGIKKLVQPAVPCIWVHFVRGRAHEQDRYSHNFCYVAAFPFWLAFGHLWLVIVVCVMRQLLCGQPVANSAYVREVLWTQFQVCSSEKKYALHNSFQHKKSKNLAFVVILGKHTGALLVFSYCRSITVSCASGFCLSSLCQLCVMPNMLQLQSSKNCPLHLLHKLSMMQTFWCMVNCPLSF